MELAELNKLEKPALAAALRRCCGATAWVEQMSAAFPVADATTLLDLASTTWFGLRETDWREAFTHHPAIGEVDSLPQKLADTRAWAAGEQGAVKVASPATLAALAAGNDEYARKFGYIFIVCATGKSADEMLALLQARLPNKPAEEIVIARSEQDKITRLRLQKLLAA